MAGRTALDVEYVRERTIRLDLRILLETATTVFSEPGSTRSIKSEDRP
jgi:lipopolysaccharide/colanic/teichoic acid biosynthesis glycosyltransferase